MKATSTSESIAVPESSFQSRAFLSSSEMGSMDKNSDVHIWRGSSNVVFELEYRQGIL